MFYRKNYEFSKPLKRARVGCVSRERFMSKKSAKRTCSLTEQTRRSRQAEHRASNLSAAIRPGATHEKRPRVEPNKVRQLRGELLHGIRKDYRLASVTVL